MTIQSNNDEIERKKFEAWLDKNSYNKQRDQKGVYQSSFCQIAWAGWMARARQEYLCQH